MDTALNQALLHQGSVVKKLQLSASKRRLPVERFAPVFLFVVDVLSWAFALVGTTTLLTGDATHHIFLFTAPSIGIFMLYIIGGYDRRTDLLTLRYASEHLISLIIAGAISMLFAYVFSAFNQIVKPSRAFVPLLFVLFLVSSLYLRRRVGAYIRRSQAARSLLVLGAGPEAKRFNREYNKFGGNWSLEFVDPSNALNGCHIDGEDSPIVEGDAEGKLRDSGQRYAAVVLACVTRKLSQGLLQQLVAMHCSSVPVSTINAFREQQWSRVIVNSVGPEWLFSSEFRLADGATYSYVKRLFDIVFSTIGLILVSPILLLVCALIRMESSGPSIFKQERVGRAGRSFVMYKLRTMYENEGDIYTRDGDIRITRIGYWLRLTRLDELPQLWNVLFGDMSLIGPRAEWIKCVEIYEKSIPNYHLRHLVNPGITGWAQVKFGYGESERDAIDKFEFDLYYIRHFSLKLDVSIVLKTIYTIFEGNGR
ncbi:MAG: exopolysaccharide biosynthesis polyprenyl glycosylphosphotransferase [Chthoniobacteraceae bacterium]